MSQTIDHKELELVKKLRSRVTDTVPAEKLQNDFYLLRWIRARDFDLDKAESMLRKSMSWARRNEIEGVLDWKPLQNYYRYAMVGHDDQGCPVFILPIGLWDLREAVEIGDIVPAFRCVLRVLERVEYEIKQSEKRIGKPVYQAHLIFDFQQFSYRQLNNRTVCQGAIEFFRIFESNYPEVLKSCMFINTPKIFPLFFALLKPFISGNTMKKMEFHGTNKKKWVASLEKKMSLEILPPHYGGTRSGIDDVCSNSSIWNDNEPLPPNYYSAEAMVSSARRPSCVDFNGFVNWKREEVDAGSKVELEFPVLIDDEPDCIQLLKWQIKSEGYDIGFQVTFSPEGATESNAKEVVKFRRIDSHINPHEGSLVCAKPGIYTVVIDNSYSKRRAKTVMHNVLLAEVEKSTSNSLQVPIA